MIDDNMNVNSFLYSWFKTGFELALHILQFAKLFSGLQENDINSLIPGFLQFLVLCKNVKILKKPTLVALQINCCRRIDTLVQGLEGALFFFSCQQK